METSKEALTVDDFCEKSVGTLDLIQRYQTSFLLFRRVKFDSLLVNTKGTIYILILIMKNSNLSLKMALLFFKVFSFTIYTLMHAFEPCVIAFFPFRLRHLQNMVLSNYVESNLNKSFSRLNVHAIFYICWWN